MGTKSDEIQHYQQQIEEQRQVLGKKIFDVRERIVSDIGEAQEMAQVHAARQAAIARRWTSSRVKRIGAMVGGSVAFGIFLGLMFSSWRGRSKKKKALREALIVEYGG